MPHQKDKNAPEVGHEGGAVLHFGDNSILSPTLKKVAPPPIVIKRTTMDAFRDGFPLHFKIAKLCLKDGRAILVD